MPPILSKIWPQCKRIIRAHNNCWPIEEGVAFLEEVGPRNRLFVIVYRHRRPLAPRTLYRSALRLLQDPCLENIPYIFVMPNVKKNTRRSLRTHSKAYVVNFQSFEVSLPDAYMDLINSYWTVLKVEAALRGAEYYKSMVYAAILCCQEGAFSCLDRFLTAWEPRIIWTTSARPAELFTFIDEDGTEQVTQWAEPPRGLARMACTPRNDPSVSPRSVTSPDSSDTLVREPLAVLPSSEPAVTFTTTATNTDTVPVFLTSPEPPVSTVTFATTSVPPAFTSVSNYTLGLAPTAGAPAAVLQPDFPTSSTTGTFTPLQSPQSPSILAWAADAGPINVVLPRDPNVVGAVTPGGSPNLDFVPLSNSGPVTNPFDEFFSAMEADLCSGADILDMDFLMSLDPAPGGLVNSSQEDPPLDTPNPGPLNGTTP